jgi:abortive infection bacteriophage resistance protein
MYEKKPTTIAEQIALLKQRGLEIESEEETAHFLAHISFYRLGEYWHSMQSDDKNHIFKPGSKFTEVIALYCFDREFRILLFEVIEKLEISLRTKLIYHLSHEFDPWWFQNFDLFADSLALTKTLSGLEEEIARSRKETSLKNHFKNYKDDGRFPPAWKTLEQTSFGTLSKLYGNLKNSIKSKDRIAQEYGAVNHTYLPSWLQSIAQIRNYCAHHTRLWNRSLPSTVKLLAKPPLPWLESAPKENEFQKIYVHLCLMKYLLNIVAPENQFTTCLQQLFNKYPNVDLSTLGIKKNWQDESLWST